MGLLLKAQAFQYGDKGCFHSWAQQQGYSHIGILEKKDTFYVLTHAFGLDALTVANSISSEGFWNNNVPKSEGWSHFTASDPECQQFNEIFAESFQESIYTISFLRLNNKDDSPFLMNIITRSDDALPSDDIDKDMILFFLHDTPVTYKRDFTKGLSIAPAKLILLSLKTDIQNLVHALGVTDNLAPVVYKTIFETVFYILQQAFQFPNYCTAGYNSEIKLALFSKSDLPGQLIKEQITYNLISILGSEAIKNMQLLSAGTSNNEDEIAAFLDKE